MIDPTHETRRRRGRRSKFTPQIRRILYEGILRGLTNELAAKAAGIDESTLYDWIKKGEAQKSGAYFEFAKSLTRARARAERRLADCVFKAAPTEWRAAAWALERRFHERWGKRENIEVSGEGGGPIQIDADPLGTLARALTDIRRRRQEGIDDSYEGTEDDDDET